MESWPETKRQVSKPVCVLLDSCWTQIASKKPHVVNRKPDSDFKKLLLDFFLLLGCGSSKSPASPWSFYSQLTGCHNRVAGEMRSANFSSNTVDLIQVISIVCIWKYIGMGWYEVQQGKKKKNSATCFCMLGHVVKLSHFPENHNTLPELDGADANWPQQMRLSDLLPKLLPP